MTRNGKIARLPRAVREELNRRLHDGELGTHLVAWLNGHPEVIRVLATSFGGRPVSEQNLSEWKAGGYQDWLAEQEALAQTRELTAEAHEMAEASGGQLSEHLTTVLTARYAGAVAHWNGEVTPEFRRKLLALRSLCNDVVDLRRAQHNDERMDFEKERLQLTREKIEDKCRRAEAVVAGASRTCAQPAIGAPANRNQTESD